MENQAAEKGMQRAPGRRGGPGPRKPPRRNNASELTALEKEFLPPLLEFQLAPPSRAHRIVLWLLIGLFAAMVTWASIGTVPIVATAPGKLIPDGQIKSVQSSEAARVRSILVRVGQHVEEGDILLELDSTVSGAELQSRESQYQINQMDMARLRAELKGGAITMSGDESGKELMALAESTQKARMAALESKRVAIQLELEERRGSLATTQARLDHARQLLEIVIEREAGVERLLQTGAVSRQQYLDVKEVALNARGEVAVQERELDRQKAAIAESEQKRVQLEKDWVAGIYDDLNRQMNISSSLESDLTKAREAHSQRQLKSPVSGIVQRVDVATIGEVVAPAQGVVTIVPDGTPLLVEATVSNRDIGYIRTGQKVDIKVDTFPFQKYGTVEGTLVWISADAESNSGASGNARSAAPGASNAGGSAEYVYKVHVRPAGDLMLGEQSVTLRAGMTVQADINTDKRRLIELLAAPILRYMDEGLKVR